MARLCVVALEQAPPRTEEGGLAGVREQIVAAQHTFRPSGDTGMEWSAWNAGQNWRVRCDERGCDTYPADASWSWGLELISHARGGQTAIEPGHQKGRAEGNRFIRECSPGVEEWYINDARGLEHGYTLARRPSGPDAALIFSLKTRGGWDVAVAPDEKSISFSNLNEAGVVLRYSGLKCWDAKGSVLRSWFSVPPSSSGSGSFNLHVDDDHAVYPVTIDPVVSRETYLKPHASFGLEFFGEAVATNGDTLVVGAPLENSDTRNINGDAQNQRANASGAAYVFERSGQSWKMAAYLKPFNTDPNDNFGFSVAISDNRIVVGAPGEDSTASIVDGNPTTDPSNSWNAGAAYVFERSGNTWSQKAYLKASNSGAADAFGSAVSVSGNLIIVSAPSEDSEATGVDGSQPDGSFGLDSGAVYVFRENGGLWTQAAYLKRDRLGRSDFFGRSVSVSGTTIAAGCPREGIGGAVYVFVPSGNSWSQQQRLTGSRQLNDDEFGSSVDISGNTLITGAPGDDSNATGINPLPATGRAASSGAAYIFHRSGQAWTQRAYLKADNTGEGDEFGTSVAVHSGVLDGNIVAVGAPEEDSAQFGGADNSLFESGAVYLYRGGVDSWTMTHFLKPAFVGQFDRFGTSVDVFQNTLATGSTGEDSRAVGVDGDETNNAFPDVGAAYAFNLFGFEPPSSILRAVSITRRQSGVYDVLFDGLTPGANYDLQTSIDLQGWANTALVTGPASGGFRYEAPASPEMKRFFRLKLRP